MKQESLKALKLAVRDDHSVSNLEQLGISQRLINLLQKNKINNMKDLMFKKKEELLRMNNFGPRQLEILLEALDKYYLVEN